MELYKKHGINPVLGILTLFIQIPIIFALYKVFWAERPLTLPSLLFCDRPGVCKR